MADGNLTLTLDQELVAKIAQAAAKVGMSEADFAALLLEQQFFDYGDYDWGDNDPRVVDNEPFDPDGPTRPFEDVMTEFREELERRLAAKA